jgi:FkbM family methyltransferase
VFDPWAVLKGVRASQPLNMVATSMTRAALHAVGAHSELVVKHLPRVGTVRRILPNGRALVLWSRGDDWVANQVYWRGWAGYEPEMAPLWFQFAACAGSVLDVGAHVGFYALLAAHANPKGRVFAFEPHPSVYERLIRNLSLNGVENVQCVKAACGARAGAGELYEVDGRGIPSGSTLEPGFMKPEWGIRSRAVSVLMLDEFVTGADLGSVDLVKLDTEGTEPQVLEGMRDTLRRHRPLIFCEVLPDRGTEEALEAVFGLLGYRYYLLRSDGPKLMDRIRADLRWWNWLFDPTAGSEAGKTGGRAVTEWRQRTR